MCFTFLAQLVQNKEPKECYERSKLLKLKKQSKDEAKEISAKLLSKQAQNLKDTRIGHALDHLCAQLMKNDAQLKYATVEKMCNFVR